MAYMQLFFYFVQELIHLLFNVIKVKMKQIQKVPQSTNNSIYNSNEKSNNNKGKHSCTRQLLETVTEGINCRSTS